MSYNRRMSPYLYQCCGVLGACFSNLTKFECSHKRAAITYTHDIFHNKCKRPHHTTCKISNLYIENECHHLTLENKFWVLLNKGVQHSFGSNLFELRYLILAYEPSQWHRITRPCPKYLLLALTSSYIFHSQTCYQLNKMAAILKTFSNAFSWFCHINPYIRKSAPELGRYGTEHGDIIKWKHFPGYWPFVRGIHRSPLNSPHKGQWRGALMFSLMCPWINGWVNNGEAGDLRCHHAHYDVTVMELRV